MVKGQQIEVSCEYVLHLQEAADPTFLRAQLEQAGLWAG